MSSLHHLGGAAAPLPRRRAALGLGLALAGVTLLSYSLGSSSPSFVNGPLTVPSQRGEAVAMWAKKKCTRPLKEGLSPFYSTLDRERLKRRRQEVRNEMREYRKAKKQMSPLNYAMLPSVEDIYAREFSGNVTTDPIGGRKRYSLHVMFKHEPQAGPESLRKSILEYIWFFKNRMSCRSVEAQAKVSPIDGAKLTQLEYPMKEYGEIPRGAKLKKVYQKGQLVQFDMYAPPDAIEYIQNRIYKDNNILRHMFLSHTREWKYLGEDNELHL